MFDGTYNIVSLTCSYSKDTRRNFSRVLEAPLEYPDQSCEPACTKIRKYAIFTSHTEYLF